MIKIRIRTGSRNKVTERVFRSLQIGSQNHRKNGESMKDPRSVSSGMLAGFSFWLERPPLQGGSTNLRTRRKTIQTEFIFTDFFFPFPPFSLPPSFLHPLAPSKPPDLKSFRSRCPELRQPHKSQRVDKLASGRSSPSASVLFSASMGFWLRKLRPNLSIPQLK